jgi:ubiquinone biosynthesis protein UbiJ
MMAPSVLCAALEIGLNRYLRLEPAVVAECEKLSGRVIELRMVAPSWSFFIEFDRGGVRVLPGLERAADVSVSGPMTTLLRLAFKTASGDASLPGGLSVEGDTELLTRFNRLLASVGFDPEEIAAKIVGDAAAHRLTQGAAKLFGWGGKTANTLALDTAEYLREETRDLARAEDVADWMDAVDQLRESTDRLEARLSLLEQGA